MTDALSILAAHSVAGTRREFVDALMRFGWSEEDAEDAANAEAAAFESAEGEALWPDPVRDRARRTAELEERAARMIDAEACAC